MEKLLYHDIYSAVYSHNSDLKLNQSSTPCEIRNAIRWIMRDNPDIFWFAHQYHYDEASSTIHFQYTFSPERVKTIQQSINNVIENDFCTAYVKKLSRQAQVAYVYKWLVSYCIYNANSAYNQNIDSVFVRRNSVCTGYAKAAQYLFNLLGIESRLVFGRLHNDKEDGRHCWNLVKVDNGYYHFDACFGDSILDNVAIKSGVQKLFKIDGINYNFLCVSTDEILRTRSIEDITTLPECPNSWSKTLINSLALIKLKQREDIKGCLLSHIGSSADIYLCSKDKNTVLKVFRPNSKTTSQEEYHYMQQTKGCQHLLQCNEDYTDISQNIVAIEQSTPIVDLLCSHYYELSLKGLIKMATDVAKAWKECQKRGVLYRDIHVCNIYRSNDGTFKLGDFGSCTNDIDTKETVGNQWFMAPETFVSGIFTEASAVYSVSMVMYFILNNLRPAFWTQGCEDEALHKRMNGHNLPTPTSCINLPPYIKTKLDKFFNEVSASLPKERISSVAEFIYELERFTFYCEDSDYIIHRKRGSIDFNFDYISNNIISATTYYTQKCNCVFLLDASDDMHGIPIIEENRLLREFLNEIRADGAASEMLDIVLISFSESAKIICQPSSINYINSPSIEARGSRNVLKAIDMSIKLVEEQKRSYLERGISYYRPYIVLITREHNNIDYELEEILGNIKEEVSSYNYQFICIVIKDVGKINLYEVNNQKFICSCNTNVKFSQLFQLLESECGVVETSEEINIVGETDWMDAFSIGDPANDADLDVDSAEDFAITAYYVSDGSTSFAGSELIVDEVENFARTRGGWNDECDSVEPNNSSDSDWCSDFRVDEIESLAYSISLPTPPHDANIVESDSSCNVDEHWLDAFVIESVDNATKESNNFSDSDWCSDFRVDEIESLAYSISLPTPPHDANIVESDSSCNVDDWMDAFVIESVHNATKESNNSSYSYESFVPFSSLSDNTRLKKLKNEYEKTITYLTRQQNLLKSVQSQIDELKNKKNKIEIHLKNSPGMIGSAVGGFLSSLIGGFVGIAGALAGSTSTSSDEAKDKLLECDKELEAKMAQALMCKKQIEDFKQQKSNLEKKLAVLEEQYKYNEVYSSIFAPAEVKRKSHLQVQVYLHLYEESEKVKSLAKESDKNAERRDYIPLSLKLKKGDKVDVEFNVYGETRLASECKSIIWQSSYTKCSFDYFVPKNIDVEELSCVALLSVNSVPIGEMRFITKVIETPRQLNPEIIAHKYSKVFISYSHLDESKVKFLHEGLELGAVPHFFDRKYLKAGDVFPQVIQDYINSADLFILCWSENASKSEYVQKERLQALERAFPQVKPEQEAKLRIYPMSIEPRTELPGDMKNYYHFGTL